MKRNVTKAFLIFLVGIFGVIVIACDTGGNGGIEVPPKYEGPMWTAVENSPFDSSLYAVAYGDGIFVAVGEDGKMAWSQEVRSQEGITWPEGIIWTAVGDSTFDSRDIYTIAYGEGIFVAGGEYGRMAYSYNGKNWTGITYSPFSNRVTAIAYGGGKFIVGGSGGKMAWSDDGINWTLVADSIFGSDSINAIAFAVLGETGRFIAAGGNGKMAWSQSDVTNWMAVDNSPFGSDSIGGITYGGGKFVAVSYDNGIAYSEFGLSWTKIENPTDSSLYEVTYGNGMFVAVDGRDIVISSDGITWTVVPRQYNGNVSASAIAYGNGKFVIGGYDGKLAYSN
jgi:hypothetical protein